MALLKGKKGPHPVGISECLSKDWEKKPQLLNRNARQTTPEGTVRRVLVKAAKQEF